MASGRSAGRARYEPLGLAPGLAPVPAFLCVQCPFIGPEPDDGAFVEPADGDADVADDAEAGVDEDVDEDVAALVVDAGLPVAASATPVTPAPRPAATNPVMTRRPARPVPNAMCASFLLVSRAEAVGSAQGQHRPRVPGGTRSVALRAL